MKGLIEEAIAREQRAAAARPRIDYERMNRIFPKQKAALTRAIKRVEAARTSTRDVVFMDNVDLDAAREALAALCKKTVAEWDECGAWPDDWARWQRALDDALPWHLQVDIRHL